MKNRIVLNLKLRAPKIIRFMVLSAFMLTGFAAPVLADDHDRGGGGDRHDHVEHGHHWDRGYRYDHDNRGYVYSPPVVYTPPPVYESPGINLVVPFNIR